MAESDIFLSLSAEVEALAQQIAGEGASQEQRDLAARVAEAQIDVTRVRRASHDLLARAQQARLPITN